MAANAEMTNLPAVISAASPLCEAVSDSDLEGVMPVALFQNVLSPENPDIENPDHRASPCPNLNAKSPAERLQPLLPTLTYPENDDGRPNGAS